MAKNVKFDKKGYPRWTMWEVVKGKTVPFLLTTAVCMGLTYSFTEIMGMVVAALLINLIGEAAIVLGMVLCCGFLPALLAAFIQACMCNHELHKLSVEEAVVAHEWGARFKWNSWFGTILGFLLYTVLYYLMEDRIESYGGVLIWVLVAVLIVGTKCLNRWMVKITHTNEALIQELEEDLRNGVVPDVVPDEMCTAKDMKAILKKLKKGSSYTLEGAIKLRDLERSSFKAVKWGAVIGVVLGVLLCSIGGSSNMGREIAEEIYPGGTPDPKKKEEERRQQEAHNASVRYYASRDAFKESAWRAPNSGQTWRLYNQTKDLKREMDSFR